jgi:hypothetical protein
MDDLFYGHGDLRTFLGDRQAEVTREVGRISPEAVLASSEADLCDALTREYTLEPPVLDREGIRQENPDEVDLDITHEPGRFLRHPDRRYYARGTRITVVVPFRGDARLFYPQPSRFNFVVPRAQVSPSELSLVYETAGSDQMALRRQIDADIDNIEGHLSAVTEEVARYNQALPGMVSGVVGRRRREALRHKGLVEGIGIPLRRREDAPATYALPLTRRKPAISAVPLSKESFEPEPRLDMADYEQVLRIIQNMAEVMERSPSAFEHMAEEDLRIHFLVQLNGQYEGEALAEAFNLAGKTDILIRHQGKNIFIAECKFWDGPKSLTDAIDQLLTYATWRDTKTAIILFSRRSDFSGVLEQIPGVVRKHAAYKRGDAPQGETTFRFVLGRPDDRTRELILTVCAFHVPSAAASGEPEASPPRPECCPIRRVGDE